MAVKDFKRILKEIALESNEHTHKTENAEVSSVKFSGPD